MELELSIDNLYLKILTPEDAPQVQNYFAVNHNHLAPWEPLRPENFYSRAQVHQRLVNSQAEAALGSSYQFGIMSRISGEMLGVVSFTGVVRGVFQACHHMHSPRIISRFGRRSGTAAYLHMACYVVISGTDP